MGATWENILLPTREERRIAELEAEVDRLTRALAEAREQYRELADSKLVLSRRLGR